MFRLRLLGIALVAAAALLIWTPAGSELRRLVSGSGAGSSSRHQSGGADLDAPGMTSGKTDRRPPRPKPRVVETYIRAKLDEIIIPRIDFDDTTVEEAIDFLRQRGRELDHSSPEPERKGISFVIRKARIEGDGPGPDAELDAEAGLEMRNPGAQPIKSWHAENISLGDALDEITRRAGLRWKIDEYAITLLPLDPETPLERHPKAPKHSGIQKSESRL